jgi:hypothetical protein
MKEHVEMLGVFGKVAAFITGLSIKGLIALSSSLCGTLGLILGEAATGQWGTAGLAGVIASGLGATFVVIPQIMKQRRESKKTYSEIREKEITSTVERLSSVCEREKAFLNLQIAELSLSVTLERGSKHDAIAELTDAQSRNIILIEQLRKAEIEPLVKVHQIDYRELSGKADDTLREMRKKTVEAARNALPTANSETKTATNEK